MDLIGLDSGSWTEARGAGFVLGWRALLLGVGKRTMGLNARKGGLIAQTSHGCVLPDEVSSFDRVDGTPSEAFEEAIVALYIRV